MKKQQQPPLGNLCGVIDGEMDWILLQLLTRPCCVFSSKSAYICEEKCRALAIKVLTEMNSEALYIIIIQDTNVYCMHMNFISTCM